MLVLKRIVSDMLDTPLLSDSQEDRHVGRPLSYNLRPSFQWHVEQIIVLRSHVFIFDTSNCFGYPSSMEWLDHSVAKP